MTEHDGVQDADTKLDDPTSDGDDVFAAGLREAAPEAQGGAAGQPGEEVEEDEDD